MLLVINTDKDLTECIAAAIVALQSVVASRGDHMMPERIAPARAPSAPIAPDDRPDAGVPAAGDAFGVAGPSFGAPIPIEAFERPSPEAAFGAAFAPAPAALASPPPAPLPPVAPPAPAAPPAPDGAQSATVLDKEGYPWDERIHSSNRKMTAKGVWTVKRGLNDDGFVAGVQAELRALMTIPAGAPPAPAAPPAPPAPPMPPAPPGAIAGQPTLPPPVSSPVGGGEPVPGAVVEHDPSTFATLLSRTTPLINQHIMTNAQLVQACAEAGIPGGPALLAPRPDLIPQVWANLRRIAGF